MPGSSFLPVFPAFWGTGSNPVTPIPILRRECPILGVSGDFSFLKSAYNFVYRLPYNCDARRRSPTELLATCVIPFRLKL